MEPREPDEEEQSRRPRVVDRRISARRADGDPSATAGRAAPDATSAGEQDPGAERDVGAPTPPDAPRTPTTGEPADASVAVGAPGGAPSEPGTIAAPPEAAPGAADSGVWTPEQEQQARQIAQQIAETPSLDWVLQAAVNLANVAGVKLDLGAVADAQLAIDALAGILGSVGSRLGDAETPLRQTLAQLQLAYAERSGGVTPPGRGPLTPES